MALISSAFMAPLAPCRQACRLTMRVLMGSLAAPSSSASRAVASLTPSSSNMMRPGLTRATQSSRAPLPEPMRTSAGFLVTGTSGKTRIQTRPARFMARVMARRAASIWRAVRRSGSMALRPNEPKLSNVPPLALPWMRPLKALRYFVRAGCSMGGVLLPSGLGRFALALAGPAVAAAIAAVAAPSAAALLRLDGSLLGRHRVVLHDLPFEDPHLHADHAVGGLRQAVAEVDVGTQRVQRHAPLAVPLEPGDLGSAEPARAVDADAERAQPQRRLHGPLHGAAEGDAPLELLGDGLGHQRGIDLGLAHLDDVEVHLRGGELGELAPELLDVGALLADQHARPRRVHGDAALLVRALDDDLGDAGLAPLLEDVVADVHVLVQQPAVLAAAGEPAAVPRAVDADAQAHGIDFVTHYSASSAGVASSCAFTTTVSCANGFSIGLMRPRPRA